MKKIAVFEVEFETDDMWDGGEVQEEFGGDWLKAMQLLFKANNVGIFEEELKLVSVKNKASK